MTNYENLKALDEKELAWFLMAYSDACRTCVYKSKENSGIVCGKPEGCKDTCISGTEKWLSRNTDDNEDDKFMFDACRNNVTVTEYNKNLQND